MLVLDPDYPEALASIAFAIHDALMELTFPDAEAQRLTHVLIEAVRRKVGGGAMYLAKGARLQSQVRRRAVLAYLVANPGCYVACATKVGLGERRVRQIEAEWRRERRDVAEAQ